MQSIDPKKIHQLSMKEVDDNKNESDTDELSDDDNEPAKNKSEKQEFVIPWQQRILRMNELYYVHISELN